MTPNLPPSKRCFIPWCPQSSEVSNNVDFFHLPTDTIRRSAWLEALDIPVSKKDRYLLTISSRHFKSGRPSPDSADIDWIPNQALHPNVVSQLKSKMRKLLVGDINEIITNIPEIEAVFDVPEFVVLRKVGESPNNDHDYVKTRPVDSAPACQDVHLPHFCNICVQEFGDLFKFNSHMLAHMHKNDVKCTLCHQSFFTTTCLNNHIRFKHTTLCQKCHKQIPRGQHYWHKLANAKQRKQILTKRDDKIWFCVFCGKKFGRVREFHKHLESHDQVL
ncbi:zinc finger protein Gfi-1b [Tribolium castaneum]|uniref:Uncharacterized protein n=1 Tax=Tribolium castaneum TaxID=7070 RepID=D6WYR8_TRICA|nr:PREDICTED: zinc finger protein Gfi-1b [Tribolium castaneum]EFA08403.1 hypothetical protein TcasGA2_TC006050 [Tribolium castaneum]|eukprot:XP_008196104.1 PREDICTED: zinc finger protein Gfi-1b [Tribolium castaneum]